MELLFRIGNAGNYMFCLYQYVESPWELKCSPWLLIQIPSLVLTQTKNLLIFFHSKRECCTRPWCNSRSIKWPVACNSTMLINWISTRNLSLDCNILLPEAIALQKEAHDWCHSFAKISTCSLKRLLRLDHFVQRSCCDRISLMGFPNTPYRIRLTEFLAKHPIHFLSHLDIKMLVHELSCDPMALCEGARGHWWCVAD